MRFRLSAVNAPTQRGCNKVPYYSLFGTDVSWISCDDTSRWCQCQWTRKTVKTEMKRGCFRMKWLQMLMSERRWVLQESGVPDKWTTLRRLLGDRLNTKRGCFPYRDVNEYRNLWIFILGTSSASKYQQKAFPCCSCRVVVSDLRGFTRSYVIRVGYNFQILSVCSSILVEITALPGRVLRHLHVLLWKWLRCPSTSSSLRLGWPTWPPPFPLRRRKASYTTRPHPSTNRLSIIPDTWKHRTISGTLGPTDRISSPSTTFFLVSLRLQSQSSVSGCISLFSSWCIAVSIATLSIILCLPFRPFSSNNRRHARMKLLSFEKECVECQESRAQSEIKSNYLVIVAMNFIVNFLPTFKQETKLWTRDTKMGKINTAFFAF